MPEISIGLPVYNGGQHLRLAVDLILEQSFLDFELIISDNASTDETEQICREFASRDNRVKYFRQSENIGVANNFRFVFEQATAPLFKWMAHDDWIDADWLSVLVPVAKAKHAIIFGYLQMVTHDGQNMAHQANGRKMQYNGPAWWRRLAFAIEPANLGKANVIYGIFPRDAISQESLRTFSTNGAPGDVMMLTECLSRLPIVFGGPSRLFKRSPAPRPPGVVKERRASIFERTMLRQFLCVGPISFRIGYLLLYPLAIGRMKYGRKLRRLRAHLIGDSLT
ncbi:MULTISPECIES: glycosyltransferase family 2 protein [unclassified Neorhizobium]|uniref:glycosyltransferase family 2 protein n=1 Tax=unclassified Neorhizobium TaxID=2629175 RepID=UPI001FF56BBE|nr:MULTISPECIES: glycosyltransferase family 2 protein [unclassified Neorhizobium]MCJ9673387.1 glycosyltransferase [Neorhizobium sp. SHOUNA12B]MCJ9748692.1 glycosyltransferase [Neorhizobium sp. SHOUNA12A]